MNSEEYDAIGKAISSLSENYDRDILTGLKNELNEYADQLQKLPGNRADVRAQLLTIINMAAAGTFSLPNQGKEVQDGNG
ncbi:hypothetical protein ACFLTR_01450 [Chloroflexota bacterium]